MEHIYLAIDLKSFYASVECMERNLDPLNTNLVVADPERTEKTICLAVSPSLKKFGISGRARLFEVVQKVKEVNLLRKASAPGGEFTDTSYDGRYLENHMESAVNYIVAPPRMALYMKTSTEIYNIYLKYVAPEDIHVYSVDEVFMDITHYIKTYNLTPRQLAMKIIRDVLNTTGITATAGIGTNLYLSKIAMDIVAKHIPADKDGVRIAQLDETEYRKKLWSHKPITDFWRVGKGYEKKLKEVGLFTMGDIAKCSIGKENDFYNEDLLYKLFGINAELLIDHAWGYEPCTIKDIKSYKPAENSLCSGQVLQRPYNFTEARLIVQEMIDLLMLDVLDKGLVTDQIVLTIGYDIENYTNEEINSIYDGESAVDRYGRKIPKHAHGTANLNRYTTSVKIAMEKVMALYDEIVDKRLLIRRINISANHLLVEKDVNNGYTQLDLFSMADDEGKEDELKKEKQMQMAVLDIKKKYGKNAIVKGMNLQKGATAIDRNRQIGGHKA